MSRAVYEIDDGPLTGRYEKIMALRAEAAEAGDLATVKHCDLAATHVDSFRAILEALRNASAQAPKESAASVGIDIVSAHEHWDEKECGGDATCPEIEREPACDSDHLTHSWTRNGEGGCDENPGVWSTGGTTLRFAAHCEHCGIRRVIIARGCQRNPYECDSVKYEVQS